MPLTYRKFKDECVEFDNPEEDKYVKFILKHSTYEIDDLCVASEDEGDYPNHDDCLTSIWNRTLKNHIRVMSDKPSKCYPGGYINELVYKGFKMWFISECGYHHMVFPKQLLEINRGKILNIKAIKYEED